MDFDLHLHSKYSQGVSKKMEIPVLATESRKKGLDAVGTGDILNPKWLQHCQEKLEKDDGIYSFNQTSFFLTTEVEDHNRVHHVIVFPDFDAVEKAYIMFKEISNDIRREGRPRIKSGGERITEIVKQVNGLIGPAHAFTPYTGMYSKHDSIRECYGEMSSEIDFLELGLSADSSMASRLSELNNITFVSNSDAHSPWPHRIGREFNRTEMRKPSFEELKEIISEDQIKLNVGLDPREGKYHNSACNSCHKQYRLSEAKKRDWKCTECSGTIKKGVSDRVKELADQEADEKNYLHLPPLALIIQKVVGHSSPTTKTVQNLWQKFYENHGTEIEILVEVPVKELKETDKEVGEAIEKFRNNETDMRPGGGGKYGEIVL